MPKESGLDKYRTDRKKPSGATGSFQETIPEMIMSNLRQAGRETVGAAKAGLNVGLFGLPEIASQKLTGQKFVPEDLPQDVRTKGEMAGFVFGAPKVLAGKTAQLGAKILPKATGLLPTMARGAATMGVARASQLPTPEEAPTMEEALQQTGEKFKRGAVEGAVLSGGIYSVGKVARGIGYATSKTKAIRSKWGNYAKDQSEQYGKGLENLPKEKIEGSDVISRLEGELIRDGIMKPDGKFNAPRNAAENKIIKAYQRIYNKWAMSGDGKLNSTDLINEYKSLKGKFSPTQTSYEARKAADKIINSVKPQLKSGAFEKLQSNWKDFTHKEELVDRYFRVTDDNPLLTGTGERAISSKFSGQGEAQTVKRVLKDTIGETLKGATAITKAGRAVKSPLGRIALIGGGLTALGALGIKGLRGMREE